MTISISRVQLPAVGRVGAVLPAAQPGRARQGAAPTASAAPGAHAARQRAQHHAQCRAACMSKANF